MRLLQDAWLVMGKDLRSELRTKESLNSAVAFSLLILLLFSFAFDPDGDQIRSIAGGLLWLVWLFAGMLVVNRGFAREVTNDCLEALLVSPLSPAGLFLGKALSSLVLLLLVQALSLPVFGLFYNARWYREWPLLLGVMVLASWALCVVGSIFSALTVNLRLRELMLPVLVYPLLVPAVMAAVQLTASLAVGEPVPADNWAYLRLLVGFDVIFTALGLALIEVVLVG